jgi:hypothetical protein
MIYTHVLNRGGKGVFSLANRFNMTAINMLVACEDGSSFFEKGRVKKEFIGKDLVTAAVLHRGLISGYTAPRAAFVGTID